MDNCWIFFRDVYGYWQWERHGGGASAVAASDESFTDAHACRHDAIHHGYLPTTHNAIYPPEFDQGSR